MIANWDVSLHDVLARFGLAERFGAIVTAAAVGIGKPDGAPFRAALEQLGVEAERAVHVGDDPVTDVAGARAAGLSALLLDRSGRAPDSLADLGELAGRLGVPA